MKYKYNMKKAFVVGQIAISIVCLLLIIGRWYNIVDKDFVLFTKEIQAHISNFSLSMLFYLIFGCIWLMLGVKIPVITCLGIFLVIANFICETVMVFMNTTDIMDAVYGTVGVVVSFVFLLLTSKYGLSPTDS